MAIRRSPHPLFPRANTGGGSARVPALHGGPMKPNRTTLRVRSYTVNDKIFEDQALGIICYRDERGEVICEGYDEGPRYSRQASPVAPHDSFRGLRGVQIPDFPPPQRLKTVEGPGVLCINGFTAEEHGTC